MTRRKVLLLALGVFAGGVAGAWPFRRPASDVGPPAENIPSVEPLIFEEPQFNPPASADSEAVLATAIESDVASSETTKSAISSPPAAAPPAEPRPVQAEKPMRSLRPVWRKHRIKDGDSLSKLAQTYLGDAAREGEIFALNRDVLASPDILPVGRWLRIPSEENDGKVY
jgi:nucleoid-associated protein YgaU